MDTYGRFPAHSDAFHMPGIWVQFSHLEIEYYERFAAPGHARAAGRGPGDLGALMGNTHGRMFALTLFTPIRRRWHPVLATAFRIAR